MIERIPYYYTGDECVLITLPFKRCITVFDDDVLCHYDFSDDSQNVNKCLNDDRRITFPYANIPMYKGLFGKYYVNLLFEYNKHYISITDGFIRDRYIVKDVESAIVMNRVLSIPMFLKDHILTSSSIKEKLDAYSDYILFDRFGRRYYSSNESFKDIDKFIDSLGGIILINDKDCCSMVKLVKINNAIGIDDFSYREIDISLNDYTVEELKYFSSRIRDVKDICIYPSINPNIDRRDISDNKRLVRRLSK